MNQYVPGIIGLGLIVTSVVVLWSFINDIIVLH